MWLCFSGPQRHLTVGDDRARRYAPGISPIIAFPARDRPDFAAIEPHCLPGERFYCEGWPGPAPPGWRIEDETTMLLMAWAGGTPPEFPTFDYRALLPADIPAMLALAQLTVPGPFGPRTPELGEYFGVFDGDRLVAMAGERFALPGHREISGVCTHPDFQARGLARGLMAVLIHRQLGRDERPFLHVMRGNRGARGLYESIGFREHHRVPVRVLDFG